jgi:ferredoxin
MNPIVVFYPEGKCAEAEAGETLLAVARRVGVALDSACGGQGACGRCRMIVHLGQAAGEPSPKLTPEEHRLGYVLACQAKVSGDLVVEVPVESQRGEMQILTGAPNGLLTGAPEGPLAERVKLKIKPPAGGDNVDDASRLLAALVSAREEKSTPSLD